MALVNKINNKRIIKSIASLLLLSLVYSFSGGIDWKLINQEEAAKELLEISKRTVKMQCYSFDVVYKSYKGHFVSDSYQQQNGYVIKDKGNYRSYLMGKLTIQNKEFRIVVDSAIKSIVVVNPFTDADPNFSLENYVKAMGAFKQIKRVNENEIVGFRFEAKAQRGITSQEVYIENDFLKKIIIYYANDISTRENNEIKKETVYPRLTVEINKFKKLEKVSKENFNTDKYITISKGILKLNSNYKNYKLSDGRFNK